MTDSALLVQAVEDVFARHCPLIGRRAETEAELARRLWTEVERADLSSAGEVLGAGGFADLSLLVRAASRFAPPIPLAETLLARWLLAEAGLDAPAGPLATGPTGFGPLPRESGAGAGRLRAVPFAPFASHLAALVERGQETLVAVYRASEVVVAERSNLAGEPVSEVDLARARPVAAAPSPVSPDALLARGALLRSQQIAGALDRILELTIAYTTERIQFGRPISKFQAVQHHVADIAAEVAAAGTAAEAAAAAVGRGADGRAAAMAKTRAGQAARAAAVAHQVLGAIGVTEEHPLHLFTRRIWSWRDDFGTEAEWAERIGSAIAAAGGAAMWSELTERS